MTFPGATNIKNIFLRLCRQVIWLKYCKIFLKTIRQLVANFPGTICQFKPILHPMPRGGGRPRHEGVRGACCCGDRSSRATKCAGIRSTGASRGAAGRAEVAREEWRTSQAAGQRGEAGMKPLDSRNRPDGIVHDGCTTAPHPKISSMRVLTGFDCSKDHFLSAIDLHATQPNRVRINIASKFTAVFLAQHSPNKSKCDWIMTMPHPCFLSMPNAVGQRSGIWGHLCSSDTAFLSPRSRSRFLGLQRHRHRPSTQRLRTSTSSISCRRF